MRQLPLFALLLTLLCSSVSAEVIASGVPISDARKSMLAAGYKQTGLDMIARNYETEELEFWAVDQGTLVARFSKATQRIIDLSFHISDERPKDSRKEFGFDVISFDPTTGLMTTRMNKGKGGDQPKAEE